MPEFLDFFCGWLADTRISHAIQTTGWAVPALQVIHILCISLVMSAVVFLDFRLIGISGREQPAASVAGRFLPFIWWPLPVLLISGSLLIAAEPARSLENESFQIKMLLLLSAIIVTFVYQRPLKREPDYWESTTARRTAVKLLAVLSLAIWTGIVLAGRWIAYVQA